MSINKRINKKVTSFCKCCKKEKSIEDFYSSSYSCCKKCKTKKSNLYHINNPKRNEYHKNYRKTKNKKFNLGSFHSRATNYCKYYNLLPLVCPICGSRKKIQLHHPFYRDYNDWKIVVFCCSRCHLDIHKNKIKCPKPIDLKIYLNNLKKWST